MRTIPTLGVALSVLVTGLAAASQTQTPAPAPAQPEVVLNVGDPAPAFSLPGSDGKTHKLSDYKGKAVVVAWFPAAFTGG
jgi:cytochrome oxidase Cu insertion factor (SCO1/SenC/PrrC family)